MNIEQYGDLLLASQSDDDIMSYHQEQLAEIGYRSKHQYIRFTAFPSQSNRFADGCNGIHEYVLIFDDVIQIGYAKTVTVLLYYRDHLRACILLYKLYIIDNSFLLDDKGSILVKAAVTVYLI